MEIKLATLHVNAESQTFHAGSWLHNSWPPLFDKPKYLHIISSTLYLFSVTCYMSYGGRSSFVMALNMVRYSVGV